MQRSVAEIIVHLFLIDEAEEGGKKEREKFTRTKKEKKRKKVALLFLGFISRINLLVFMPTLMYLDDQNE